MKRIRFPFYKQLDKMDCGPSCLRMIAKYYGRSYSLQYLREKSFLGREGVSLLGISNAAETIGMRTISARVTLARLEEEVPFPCIIHWYQKHFTVVYQIRNNKVYVADPAHGLITYTREEFLRGWINLAGSNVDEGIVLMLEPTPEFYLKEDDSTRPKTGLHFFAQYLRPYSKMLIQVIVSMVAGTVFGLLFPFLTQAIVDVGINNQNIGFVYTILIAQLMLFLGRTTIEFIRSWILLHIGSRINISIISDFLNKLMKLSISFFDSKMIGDILQRIGDNQRIQGFLTSTSLNTLFSIVNLIVFGLVLALYSGSIFLIFFVGSAFSTAWILLFMKKRRDLDYKRFEQLSENQSRLIQLIYGMQEIKLNGSERPKRWEWERVQAKLFKVNIQSLIRTQYQEGGTLFLNELKNIIISFFAAKEVIDGSMTLGMMMAVQYIIGQLNSPISQLINFFQTAQDAKISLERMGEIYDRPDEESSNEEKITIFPSNKDLTIANLDFQYNGPHSENVLQDLYLHIPEGKVTAIVGSSGSGKTTLLKILLKFYKPLKGEIRLGEVNLDNFSSQLWRQRCGVVMQDGFIFSDSIAKNIIMNDERFDKERLMHAIRIANIHEFVDSLPIGFNTKIGSDGHGLSQGQRQRILIARAVYKNPDYLFFDEATSALDAKNERTIIDNLREYFVGKTVIIIAHRLSTVQSAHQIAVLEKGRIVEHGNHRELTEIRGNYFNLVKNQLELGT